MWTLKTASHLLLVSIHQKVTWHLGGSQGPRLKHGLMPSLKRPAELLQSQPPAPVQWPPLHSLQVAQLK